jgi:DNA invertase Pin-like site-specific DNA recombinase
VVVIYSDAGIFGSKGRGDRPGLDQMLNDAGRRKFDIVMAWAIDRVGRSLIDLLGTIQHLEAVGVDLYLDHANGQADLPGHRRLYRVRAIDDPAADLRAMPRSAH